MIWSQDCVGKAHRISVQHEGEVWRGSGPVGCPNQALWQFDWASGVLGCRPKFLIITSPIADSTKAVACPELECFRAWECSAKAIPPVCEWCCLGLRWAVTWYNLGNRHMIASSLYRIPSSFAPAPVSWGKKRRSRKLSMMLLSSLLPRWCWSVYQVLARGSGILYFFSPDH